MNQAESLRQNSRFVVVAGKCECGGQLWRRMRSGLILPDLMAWLKRCWVYDGVYEKYDRFLRLQ